MSYRLNPVEINVAEGGFADFNLCNDNGEQVVTFGFADEHEARIAQVFDEAAQVLDGGPDAVAVDALRLG